MARNSPDSRSAARSADVCPGSGCPSQPATGSCTVRPASANPPAAARHADPAAPSRYGGPPRQPARSAAAAAASRISAAAPTSPLTAIPFPPSASFPTAISKALMRPNGLGGEPARKTSTGTVASTPPVVSWPLLSSLLLSSLRRSSPPLTASVPAAMTILGSGIAS